jgi:mRNA interferase HigB
MHVITRKRLNDFADLYPEVKTALQHWYRVIKSNSFNSFNKLKILFPYAHQVGKLIVFNIAGDKVRLIAAIPKPDGFCKPDRNLSTILRIATISNTYVHHL